MIRIVINGKLYEKVTEAYVDADGDGFIVYCDDSLETHTLYFNSSEIEEWIVTR